MSKRHHLDTCGTMCPEPLRLAGKRLLELSAGDTLVVQSDDPAAGIDFEVWCLRRGHDLLACEKTGSVTTITLRKGNPQV